MVKLLKYCTVGVREYWIIDPAKKMASVYQIEQKLVEQYSFGEEVPVGI